MRRTCYIALFLALAAIAGCKEKESRTIVEPIEFASETAQYALTLPAGWKLESAEKLNTFADLAASYKGTHYLIVIPQQLPVIPGVETPDALALRRASVAVMEEQIEDFEIDRRGPVKLAGRTGQSVFASGVVEGQSVKYVTTYATRGGWGYQIVGWGPADKESTLVSQIDRVLATWKFTEAPTDEDPEQPDEDKNPDNSPGISPGENAGDSTTEN